MSGRPAPKILRDLPDDHPLPSEFGRLWDLKTVGCLRRSRWAKDYNVDLMLRERGYDTTGVFTQ